MYMLAILVPPLAALLAGKPFQAIICLILMLTLIGWIPASIWACLIVSARTKERQHRELIRELKRGR